MRCAPRHVLALPSALILVLVGCTPSGESGESGESSSMGESDSTTQSSTSEPETQTQTETETETGTETETETETGEPCTGEVCSSTLTMHFDHSLPLLEGPHRLLITTLNHDIQCGIEPELEGSKSCFGFIFADLSWNEARITVTLTSPFYDTDTNPEGDPFTTIYAELERGNELLWEMEVPVDVGEPIQPDPCGLVCWETLAQTTIELAP